MAGGAEVACAAGGDAERQARQVLERLPCRLSGHQVLQVLTRVRWPKIRHAGMTLLHMWLAKALPALIDM